MSADDDYAELQRTSLYEHGIEAIAEVLTRLKPLREKIGQDIVFVDDVSVKLAYDASDAFVEIWWDNESEGFRVRPLFEPKR